MENRSQLCTIVPAKENIRVITMRIFFMGDWTRRVDI